MNKTAMIEINITGPVQSGKSAILQTIKEHLEEQFNLCVAVPDRSERLNPSANMDKAANHERPKLDKTVIVLTEGVSAA